MGLVLLSIEPKPQRSSAAIRSRAPLPTGARATALHGWHCMGDDTVERIGRGAITERLCHCRARSKRLIETLGSSTSPPDSSTRRVFRALHRPVGDDVVQAEDVGGIELVAVDTADRLAGMDTCRQTPTDRHLRLRAVVGFFAGVPAARIRALRV